VPLVKRWTILPGDFLVSEEDVLAVEAALPAELAAMGPSLLPSWGPRTPFWERLDDYRRQYTGVVRGGERLLIGNVVHAALCKGTRWETELVSIEDGGYGVITVTIHLPSRLFLDFVTNGYA
jgi:hypothetical protein